MALVLRTLYDGYNEFLISKEDNPNARYPLMKSPVPTVIIVAAYLYFVKYFGPKWMATRKSLELKNIIIVYNLIQIIANFSLGSIALYNTYCQPHYTFSCQDVAIPGTQMAAMELRYAYLYYVLKVFDLFDTVFFVLRKKTNQVSFLHVYHHALMVLATWGVTKFIPGGHSTLLGILNCFVHVFMYIYYLLTAFSAEVKNSIWWKKRITQTQMIQFGILMVHFGRAFIYHTCEYPLIWLFFCFVQNGFMFLLFLDFYRRSYLKKKTK